MITAIAYLRISEDPDDLRLGVDRQRADVTALAERLGADLLKIYEDNDVSATKVRKKDTDWQRALDRIGTDKPTYLLGYRHDRLGRRLADIEGLDDLCRSTGTRVYLVEGGDLFNNPAWPFLAAAAKSEAMAIGTRVKRAHRAKREKGLPTVGGLRPYGYLPDRMTLVPEEAEVIREVAHRIIEGESTTSVMKWMNDSGLKTVTGKEWTATTLKQMLRNPRYQGDSATIVGRSGGQRQYEVHGVGQWPAILDRGTWAVLQERLDERGNNTRGRPRNPSLLGGILRCLSCKRPMFIRTSGRKSQYHYYRCDPGGGGCGRTYRRVQEMDEYVTGWVLDHGEVFSIADERAALAEQVKMLRHLIWIEQGKRDDAHTAYDEGRAGVSALEAADRAAARLSRLEREVHTVEFALARLMRVETVRERWEAASLDEKRTLIRAHVEAIWCERVDARIPFDPHSVHIDARRDGTSSVTG